MRAVDANRNLSGSKHIWHTQLDNLSNLTADLWNAATDANFNYYNVIDVVHALEMRDPQQCIMQLDDGLLGITASLELTWHDQGEGNREGHIHARKDGGAWEKISTDAAEHESTRESFEIPAKFLGGKLSQDTYWCHTVSVFTAFSPNRIGECDTHCRITVVLTVVLTVVSTIVRYTSEVAQ